eukprot:5379672-Pyramimonas_sp.AAC.2
MPASSSGTAPDSIAVDKGRSTLPGNKQRAARQRKQAPSKEQVKNQSWGWDSSADAAYSY